MPLSQNTKDRRRLEQARQLSSRLPDLLVAARRIATNVMMGVHGRRRAGPGETFWQFRPYVTGEPAKRIDWRRSARDHHLYVREREWEAAQTIWIWPDLTPSMAFRSQLSQTTKLDRAVVLGLAIADMLARGGERVGVPGLMEPRIGQDTAERIAIAMLKAEPVDWPPTLRLARFADVIVLSDCLAPIEELKSRLQKIAAQGARLHILQILDPAEETFPYEGRLEFRDPETGGTWLAERAGGLKERYRNRLAAHREELATMARRAGYSFAVHHTDRPAAEGLLFLHGQLSGGRGAMAMSA